MGITIRSFDTMVDAILNRIVNANIGITNTTPGSVVRTLVESIVAEIDVQYYQINRLNIAMFIEDASGDDLDRLILILGVTRKPATYNSGTVTFSTTEAALSNILIPIDTILSTEQDTTGNIIEFVTTEDATLLTGQTSVNAPVIARVAGAIYIPVGAISVMNVPISGIVSVTNGSAIANGTDKENDDDLRDRAKSALAKVGKGTCDAMAQAVLDIDGVSAVLPIDMSRGVGTADLVVITTTIPPSSELLANIGNIVDSTKPAGIDVDIVIPTIQTVNVSVNTTAGIDDDIGNAIVAYTLSLSVSDSFIINQMERYVLNACNIPNMDITTVLPASNVAGSGTTVIRIGTITINGVLWNG